MGKKRARFDWSADPDDPALRVPVERESRAPLKLRLAELQALANDLAELPTAARAELPLGAEVLEALQKLADTRPSPARKRQLNYVKRLMAEVDVEAVRTAMAGETPRAARLREADRWRERLVADGDDAFAAFLSAHGHGVADRQHLRSLVRRASSGGKPSRALFDAIVAALEAGAA